ncbi:MAG: anthranilate synthase component I [Eggerthellaceae bacterium]|jgi:anthranilate synthase component 1
MLYPSLEEAKQIASTGNFGIIPVATELFSDQTTPIRVLEILKGVSDHVYLLESVEDSTRWGRYSFLGYDPTMELTCLDGTLRITRDGVTETTEHADPRPAIKRTLAENRSPQLSCMPSFTGGLVGYFSYDYLKYSEPTLTLDAADVEHFNDVDLMLFDKVIAFDNLRQKIVLITNIRTDDLDARYQEAKTVLAEMGKLISEGTPQMPPAGHMTGPATPLFEEQEFCSLVKRAKEHIREGDIFQVVLSNRLEAPYEGSLLNAYRVLRTINPSPYLFYFTSNDIELTGASPETLAKLENGKLYSFPLAGTRPRGKTAAEDDELEADLLKDEKELAEHNMLVDLGRNDVGKVCEFGTVTVDRFHEVLKFSHVMHIGSQVSGTLRPDRDALDAIDAVLPAGTLSGAPKLRAAQIINEMENDKRGIYGGAIGYLSFTGNMDTCIAIRLAFAKNGKVYVRSGAGIVADSVPETEFHETINKAKAMVSALEIAQEDPAL